MTIPPKPLIASFGDGEPYTQAEPPGASFRWLLKQGDVAGLCMGLVTLEGPIHKTPASHAEWDQVYLIFQGQGTIHLGEVSQHVSGPTVVVIPRNTRHSVQLAAGESIQYVFVNEYL